MNVRRLIAAALVLAAAGHAQGQAPALVDVAAVEQRDLAPTRRFVGTVRPVKESIVGSETEGLVQTLAVEEGDHVAAGDPLATLKTTTVDLRLRAARAQLRLRQVELQELVNGARKEEIAEAKARVARDDADVALRQWKHDAARRLFSQDTISEDEVKETLFALRAAEATREEGRAKLALVEQGPREEKIEQARAQVAVQEAEVARLEDDLARHTVRAPFPGFVVAKRTEAGQWVRAGDPVVMLLALDQVDVVVPVPEAVAVRLRADVPVTVRVPSFGADRSFAGTIAAIVPQADLRGRTLPVKIRLKNPVVDGRPVLQAGMLAHADVAVGAPEPTLVVPKDALVLGGAQPIVYKVGDDGAVQAVPVTVGAGHADGIAVHGQLQAGDLVVVVGNERLRPGQKVRPRE